jgi:hypothetical protein
MKAMKKVYSHFNFFTDFSVGLTISNTKDLKLGLYDYRLVEQCTCKNSSIKISKPVRYDELSSPDRILEEFFKEICVNFGLVLPEKAVVKEMKEIFEDERNTERQQIT